MLEYARWKYILIVVVLLLSTLFALPNVFGDDPAIQIARADHTNLKADDATAIVSYLKDQKITVDKSYVDDGKVMLRFADTTEQFKARDAIKDHYKDQYIAAMLFASRAPDFFGKLGLRPMPLGLDLRGGLYLLYQGDVKGAVAQFLEGYAQDARRVLSGANIQFKDVSVVAANGGDQQNAIRIVLPPESDVTAARTALAQPFQGVSLSTDSLPSGSAIVGTLSNALIK